MYSNRYTLLYAIGFTTIVSVILAVAATSLRPMQERNIAQAKRRAILQSVMDVNAETLEEDYSRFITERTFDAEGNEITEIAAFDVDVKRESKKLASARTYPVFVYSVGDDTRYIIPLQGAGLWGPISAYLALDADGNTVSGVVFEHEKETPGLGAEINTAPFQDQFRGKKFFGDDGTFESIRILKGSGNDIDGRDHVVDGLTGATMTMNGVNRMLRDEVAQYAAILKRLES